MVTFKHILFPVDFSDQCRAVVPCVKAMLERFGSQLTVLHVLDLPQSWFGSPEAAAWAALINADRLRAQAKIAVDRFLAQEFAGMPVKGQVAEGDAALQIAEYADEDSTDLIMLPTHGYGAFRALLLGSVAAKVLHDTHCPVWTGVHALQLTAHPPQRWKHMLCAVDLDIENARILKWASEFCNGQGTDLRLVHAVLGADPLAKENDPSLYQFLFNTARERIAKLQQEAGTNLDVCLMGGSVDRVVHRAAVGHDADLIIIGRGTLQKPLGRLRSAAYSIIREAPCPVISI
jgi:nucleotide-binding universal stress UspA family protein